MSSMLQPVILLTFVLSFAAILIQRGIFFFFNEHHHLSGTQSLLVALVTGAVYVGGACLSHRFTRRVPERRALLLLLGGLAACAAACWFLRGFAAMAAAFTIFSLLTGMTWPVVESFAASVQDARAASRSIGVFSISWSLALPLSVWASGPLIKAGGGWLFAAAVLLLAAVAALAFRLPGRPHHALDGGAPAELPPAGYRPLLHASRWTMVVSYALLMILVPLLPLVLKERGYPVAQATFFAGLLDIMRPGVFAVMLFATGWHGRRLPLLAAALLLPAGFALTLYGSSPWVFVPGELIFGVGASIAYYCALYYAMVLSRGSVDGGGGHEAVVGTGFTIGPLAAFAGQFLGAQTGHPQLGLLAGIAPIIAVCLAGTFASLAAAGKVRKA